MCRERGNVSFGGINILSNYRRPKIHLLVTKKNIYIYEILGHLQLESWDLRWKNILMGAGEEWKIEFLPMGITKDNVNGRGLLGIFPSLSLWITLDYFVRPAAPPPG